MSMSSPRCGELGSFLERVMHELLDGCARVLFMKWSRLRI